MTRTPAGETRATNIKHVVRRPYRITATDRNAIIEQFAPHMPAIVHGLRLSAEGQEPEDFLGEAYVALIEAVDAYESSPERRRGIGIEAYVGVRVRARVIDKQRYYSAFKRHTGRNGNSIGPVNASGQAPETDVEDFRSVEGPEQHLGDILLDQAIASLPRMERIIIRKCRLEGWTETEVAAALGVSTHRVRYRHEQALKTLKAILSEG